MIEGLSGYSYGILLDDLKNQQNIEKITQKGNSGEILKEKIQSYENFHSKKKLLDVCYEMESIFIGNMLKSMRRTINESDFFGKSIAKDIFRDMLYDEYAKVMARTDQLGLARQIYDQLRVQKNS